MKNMVKALSLMLVVALGLGSCSKDKVDYTGNPDNGQDNIGYLALGGMEASILVDTDNVDSVTRAEGVDINTFNVVITNQAGETMASFTYGERPTEPIALDGGVYKITMESEPMVGAEWEKPVYGAERDRPEQLQALCRERREGL